MYVVEYEDGRRIRLRLDAEQAKAWRNVADVAKVTAVKAKAGEEPPA
jgi:hypothetical protein